MKIDQKHKIQQYSFSKEFSSSFKFFCYWTKTRWWQKTAFEVREYTFQGLKSGSVKQYCVLNACGSSKTTYQNNQNTGLCGKSAKDKHGRKTLCLHFLKPYLLADGPHRSGMMKRDFRVQNWAFCQSRS